AEQSAREALAQEIKALIKRLPTTIPTAAKDGKIYTVVTGPQKESTWMTFNSRFDALYGEDYAVSKYLDIAVAQPGMMHEPMMLKLERLKKALTLIWCATAPPPLATTSASAPPKAIKRAVDPRKVAEQAMRALGEGALADHLMPP
ncbi:hypothetical protein BD626DRAFT_362948, partial [Schizophyllum amplum]